MIAWTDNNEKSPDIKVVVRKDYDEKDYFRLTIGKTTILFNKEEFLKLHKEVEETFLSHNFSSIDNA
jgi:hypothetical protein